jgi:hypothetical protein
MFYQNRMQVLFKLRRNYRPSKRGKPKPAEVALYARITVNTYTADISTNVKVNPKHWNQAKQKVADAAPTADLDNQLLERMKVKLKKAFNLLDQDDVHVTAQQVLEVYRGQKRVRYTIQTMLERLLKQHEERISDDPDELATSKDVISGDTYEAYQKYTNNILEYLVDSKQTRVYIDEIDEAWLNEFKAWGHRRFNKANYLSKHMDYLKKLLRFAVLKKAVRNNSIAFFKIERHEPDPDDNVFLYLDELEKVQTFDFTKLAIPPARAARFDRIRDAYIFMAYIGTHFGEYSRFVKSPEKYLKMLEGQTFIRMKRTKTKQSQITHLKPINFQLAAKYGGWDKLPICSRTQFNDGLTLISAYLELGKHITTKSARKTFADHALNENTTARMMGLASTQYIKHYGNIDERRLMKVLGLPSTATSEPTESEQKILQADQELIDGKGIRFTLEELAAFVEQNSPK